MRKEDGMSSELEAALRSLRPAEARLDAAEAAFTAGTRIGRRQLRLWRGVSGVLLLAGVSAWVLPFGHTSQAHLPAIVQVPTMPYHPPQTSSEPLSQVSVLRLQQAIDKQGLAGLPETNIPPLRPMRMDGI
jgi:hypothetical protein